MNIYKKIYLINRFINYLSKKDNQLNLDLSKINYKKISVHVLKSDFLILNFVNFTIYILNILNFFFGKKNNLFFFIFFYFFFKKLREIIISVILIHNSNFFERYTSRNLNVEDDYFEHIVLGSGPSGSINSYYLNKIFPGKVLLLEKGKDVSIFKNKHPHDEFLNKWKNGGLNSTLYPMQISFASGECLGGGSEINSGLFHKPSKKFWQDWKKNSNYIVPEISKITSHFDDIERITESVKLFPNSQSYKYFLDGCNKSKIIFEHIPQFYSKLGDKNSMKATYLDLYLRANGKIQTSFEAIKIKYCVNKKQWSIIGKTYGKKKIFQCKYLFLNCGAIQTSKILINSNLFSKEVSNFKLHPMIKFVVEFDKEVQAGHENVHPFQVSDKDDKFIIGEASSGQQFIKMNFINDKHIYQYIEKNWKKMSVYHSTFSFGRGDIKKIPFTNNYFYKYNIQNSEVKLIKDSLLKASKILFSGGAKKIYLIASNSIIKIDSNDYENKIRQLKKVSELKFSAVHILGGIKSGEDQSCIADSFGKIKKYKNLYINDSSLINENLLRNPQGTIMLLAKKNIEDFIEKYKINDS